MRQRLIDDVENRQEVGIGLMGPGGGSSRVEHMLAADRWNR